MHEATLPLDPENITRSNFRPGMCPEISHLLLPEKGQSKLSLNSPELPFVVNFIWPVVPEGELARCI